MNNWLPFALTALALFAACIGQAIHGSPRSLHPYHAPPPLTDSPDNADLLDILLVASVDGYFHALNRTSGAKIWSMSSSAPNLEDPLSPLSPLVHTKRPTLDPDLVDDSEIHETYLVEPQTGNIYVATSPDSPLSKLPYSVPQLAENSPSYFSLSDGSERMVVSQKETSLLLIELETGRIKASINSQCPRNFFSDPEEVLLDDLEQDDASPPKSTNVFFGRTDYRISIYQSAGRNSPLVKIQDLSYSSYGPNSQDLLLQAAYTRTRDDVYVQTQSDGKVLATRASSQPGTNPIAWIAQFKNPIVAVFDVFEWSPKDHFVLLQPPPQLHDIFPAIKLSDYPGNAFVGQVKGTDSLYVLSPITYPFVGFGGSQPKSLPVPPARYGIEGAVPSPQNLCDSPGASLNDPHCMTGHKALEQWTPNLPPEQPPKELLVVRPSVTDNNDSNPVDQETRVPFFFDRIGWRTSLLTFFIALGSIGVVFSRTITNKSLPSPTIEAPTSLSPPLEAPIPPAPLDPGAQATSDAHVRFVEEPMDNPPADEPDAAPQNSPRKKTRRSGRGGQGRKKKVIAKAPDNTEPAVLDETPPTPRPNLSFTPAPPEPERPSPSLVVSDTVLGFGSHGTVVFKGSLQGRAVAVKRLLKDFVTLASREVSILQESDYHPNVIRYYYQEAHSNFLYIALELCPASLADIIEYPDRDEWRDIAISFEPKKALQQVTAGIRHLHGLKIVHRDIKPQNILISTVKSVRDKPTYRMLISDFGLCKKLDLDQTSFLPTAHGSMAAGTVGWRAPEVLRGEVKLDDISDDSSSQGSVGSSSGVIRTLPGKPTRLTKSVDIFSLGCLYYYTMTNGSHPFGDRFEREMNILKDSKQLAGLAHFGEEGSEALDLIESMLSPDASNRPDTTSCLMHPFFWDHGHRLNFLQDASDRFEIMCRDPKDLRLIALEEHALEVVGPDWRSRLDKTFLENLGKFRKYDGASVQDLLRALRNKKNHYQDLPDHVKRTLGPLPDGFLSYFTRRYPRLFLHVHSVVRSTSLRTDPLFRPYFDIGE